MVSAYNFIKEEWSWDYPLKRQNFKGIYYMGAYGIYRDFIYWN